MSLIRTFRRAEAKRTGTPWPKREQSFKARGDGGYSTLRPTKGWITVSGRRLNAQRRMAQLLGA